MNTPFLPGLRASIAPMGSRIKSTLGSLGQATLCQIEEHLGRALDPSLLKKPATKDHSRDRIFSLHRTFWCWIWQVLQCNTSCREVVRQVQALFAAHARGKVHPGTGAYCKSRSKLPVALMEKAFLSSAVHAEKCAPGSRLLQGRPLKIADGTSLRLQDTPSNRAAFPPCRNQHSRLGFPLVKMVAIFSAASGAILGRAIGSFDQSENRLLKSLREILQKGDILIGDRHFGYYALAAWLQSFSADLLARVPTRSRHVDFRQAFKRLGRKDALFIWRKPKTIATYFSPEEWASLPEQMTVRVLRKVVENPGFRTREITLVTTLLDPQLYPAEEIIAAYLKRWRMEMCLDDLKTTLGMEMLSSRSPRQVRKEILVFLTAHNLVRWIMANAQGDMERLSFKGTLDGFRQWSIALAQIRGKKKGKMKVLLWRDFLAVVAADEVPSRPGRREPRAVKKRPKYPLLQRPRRIYVEPLSRTKRRVLANAMKKNEKLK
jgi:hypothetical protein